MSEQPTTGGASDEDSEAPYSAGRAKAFIDAVVAIAMTLLILPLMDAATEGGVAGQTGARWLDDHSDQLFSFALSFVIIAMFWLNHHGLFARVQSISRVLLWLNMAWLLSIVWLPVATALSGASKTSDPVVKAVYIGSMIVTSLLTLVLRLYLRSHPELHEIPDARLLAGMAVDLSMAVLFALALALAILVPNLGYWALFVMLLTGLAQRMLERLFGVPAPAKKRARSSKR